MLRNEPQHVNGTTMDANRCPRPFIAALLTFSALPLWGCSIGMYFDGLRRDNADPYREIRLEELRSDDRGETIEVILKGGRIIGGRFIDIIDDSAGEYERRYTHWREQTVESDALPSYGEDISLATDPSGPSRYAGRFIGLNPTNILAVRHCDNDTLNFWLPAVAYLSGSHGNRIDLAKLRKEMVSGKAPMMSSIMVTGDTWQRRIRVEEIDQIRTPVDHMHRWTGFLHGAVLDAVIVGGITVLYALSWRGVF